MITIVYLKSHIKISSIDYYTILRYTNTKYDCTISNMRKTNGYKY